MSGEWRVHPIGSATPLTTRHSPLVTPVKRTAHALSALLHPVLMPLLTLVLAFRMDMHLGFFVDQRLEWMSYALVGSMTMLFPVASVLLLYRARMISDLGLARRAERPQVFLAVLFYFLLTYHLIRQIPHHPATHAVVFGGCMAVLLSALVTLRWKISAHLVGIGGLVGALSGLMVLHRTFAATDLAVFIVLAGALGTARIVLGAHSPAQVHAGFALGFASTYTCVAYGIAP